MLRVRLSSCRQPYTPSFRHFSSSRPHQKQRLVIIGSGWGGYPLLRGVDKKHWDVTVVSPTNYFNFTPLLASCAVGTLEFRSAIEPVRRYTPQVTAYQAWCDSIDWTRRVIECTPATPSPPWSDKSEPDKFTLRWDKLVIAAGAYSQTFGIPGVKEHAHFLKDVKDARAIRTRILECFEQAMQPTMSDVERRNLLNFCIVGGGPTGVEFAAELHDLLHAEFAVHYPSLAKLAKITIYDVAPSILGSFNRNLVEYAEKTFSRDGISILTSHHVERVEAGKMFVKQQGEVPFGLLVWSTGLAPNPLISSITHLKKDVGAKSLLTNDHLNVIGATDGAADPDVWAIGDCAQITGAILPATAQVANQKARYLAKILNKLARNPDHQAQPFKFENQGSLAYLGNWKAIYDTDKDKLLGPESGRVAWLLWRSAYFTMTLSLRNKILVPMYWFLNWIFGRDITRF
ncbi:FAD/NAD(P)-binding domain-containing protein [Mycena indigotica]|uniref:FAD/NAD(P)-binding domain-containing protein n=1 Tax=Mycena indigotica TaxID=2126181 RepID=A0A8H6S5V4_9AGAR|nr:FAD/NAD(P)-binding domain-containing protein [Mycena indigotica]KAF7292785.1 FAD/NAD(P)-binding domain-containing protein [Mycena indigotica]